MTEQLSKSNYPLQLEQDPIEQLDSEILRLNCLKGDIEHALAMRLDIRRYYFEERKGSQ